MHVYTPYMYQLQLAACIFERMPYTYIMLYVEHYTFGMEWSPPSVHSGVHRGKPVVLTDMLVGSDRTAGGWDHGSGSTTRFS